VLRNSRQALDAGMGKRALRGHNAARAMPPLRSVAKKKGRRVAIEPLDLSVSEQ